MAADFGGADSGSTNVVKVLFLSVMILASCRAETFGAGRNQVKIIDANDNVALVAANDNAVVEVAVAA